MFAFILWKQFKHWEQNFGKQANRDGNWANPSRYDAFSQTPESQSCSGFISGYYNFCSSHRTLRGATTAMEAGIVSTMDWERLANCGGQFLGIGLHEIAPFGPLL